MDIEKLKKEYYNLVEKNTPGDIKNTPIFNLENPEGLELTITKELVEKWQLEEWLANYRKEAEVSTAGIRGAQNILYPWDTRFPLNQLGIALATLGKAFALKEKIKNRPSHKIASGEVRYNTKSYVELISRIQAGLGIHTHLPFRKETTPVWVVSFLIFMFDYDGGEYVTSSHAISSKIATKDLNDQGSQFSPAESLAFVAKIEEIIKKAKSSPKGYTIKLAPRNHPIITEDFDGIDLYVEYLKNGVATEANLDLIRKEAKKGFLLLFDTVGGCMYKTMLDILKKLEILPAFEWNNKKEDPFFHGIGKTQWLNPKTGKVEFFDLSCDACLLDVVKTMGYEKTLKDKPIGYVVLITDPDGDRLVIGQVESRERIPKIENLGINYIKIDSDKIFTVYHPTYSFLITMDFYMKQLKVTGLWENFTRFMIKTTPSSLAWDEWAKANNIQVINVPVGFKEIASIMKKVEKQIETNPQKEVVVRDIYGNRINLGKNPRLVFGGEESGGMIIGPENLIKSNKGRTAIAMREKSAGEASIITTALAAYLHKKKMLLSEYLEEVFKNYKIVNKYYIRDDIIYYNESEPDPEKLKAEKQAGEILRDKTDLFYLGLSIALKQNLVNTQQARTILKDVFKDSDFDDMKDIIFIGDATYLKFKNMFIEIRKSGTDAKMRGYSCGEDKVRCKLFLDKLLHYSGEITPLYDKLIPKSFRDKAPELAREIYIKYLEQEC